MAYPRNHLYLTVHWVPTYVTTETGQFGLRFDSQAAPTQTLVDACKSAIQTFWTTAGSLIPTPFSLRFARLARIGTDGKYVPGSVAFDGVFSTGLAGGASETVPQPLQLAMVSSLRTAVPRGQGSHGRVYLPAPAVGLVVGEYRWPASTADARSSALATLITSLNTTLGGPCVVASKGTVRGGPGLYQAVNGVETGRKPDVQRRRARNVLEAYGTRVTV